METVFAPKFVDLVRSYTATTGTGNFTLGPGVTGYTGFAEALQRGDCFYYSTISIDRPSEREVGRGQLLADGTVSREPLNGPLTVFTPGTKSIALIVAAEWFNETSRAIASGMEARQGGNEVPCEAQQPGGEAETPGKGSAIIGEEMLLPCAHCKSPAHQPYFGETVECTNTNCKASTRSVEAWNTRSPEVVTDEMIEAGREAWQAIIEQDPIPDDVVRAIISAALLKVTLP